MRIIDKIIFEQFGGVLFIKYFKIPEISVFNREIYKKKSKITAVPTDLLLMEALLLFGSVHNSGSSKLLIHQGQH